MDEKNKYTGMDILDLAQMAPESVFDEARQILETLVGYKELRMMYACALKEVRTKFEVLDVEFNVRYQPQPDQRHPYAAQEQPEHSGKNAAQAHCLFRWKTWKTRIQDRGGRARHLLLCGRYLSAFPRRCCGRTMSKLIAQKDYIQQLQAQWLPQPAFDCARTRCSSRTSGADLPVEVQIRTIAMDFWASLEHQLKYKQNVPEQEDDCGAIAPLRAAGERFGRGNAGHPPPHRSRGGQAFRRRHSAGKADAPGNAAGVGVGKGRIAPNLFVNAGTWLYGPFVACS